MDATHQKSKQRGVALFFAWSLLLLTGLFLVRVVLDARLAAFGVIADGVVTKIEMTTSSGGGTTRRSSESQAEYHRRRDRNNGASISYHATVRFTPAGGEPRDFKTVSTFGHDLNTGAAVKVIHMASNPGVAEIYSAKQVWLPLGVGITVTTLCGALGIFLLRLARRMKPVSA